MNIKTPERFLSVIEKIKTAAGKNGFEVYAVGGFVRDILLNREPYDLDIMAQKNGSSHDKFDGINLSKLIAAKYGLSQPVVFEKFGTSKLIIDGEEVEFVMPRKEYYDENSRNPDTELGSLEQDALRRDFTVNALFLRLSDFKVLDLTGRGFEDLKDKVLRVTDPANADIIFSQDPLRILRAVRQSLQLGFKIEPETYKAMKNNAARIAIVSPERIRDEFNKIQLEKKPSKAFKMLDDIGLLKEILPEIDKLKNLAQPEKYHSDDVFEHTLKVLDRTPPDLVLRVAALLHDTGKFAAYKNDNGKISFHGHEIKSAEIAQDFLNRYKSPKDFSSLVIAVIKEHMRPKQYSPEWSDAAVRRFVKECGDNFDRIIEFSKADYCKDDNQGEEKLSALIKRIKELKEKKMLCPKGELVSGQELIDYFKKPAGQWVGQAKAKIAEMQIENPKITKEEALKRL